MTRFFAFSLRRIGRIAGVALAALFPLVPASFRTILADASVGHSPGRSVPPSDADIRRTLAERVDALAGTEDGIGIVVGVIDPRGRRIVSYGHLNQSDPRPLTGDTVFEIASVTKGFTGLLLAAMVQTGEVALSDPAGKYLAADVKLPERNGRSITLLDLATHTSGLPFMPAGDPPSSDADLYAFLATYKLPRDIGDQWEYSNIDYWLLSQALAARAGTKYEDLLLKRVLRPLKLTHTAFTPSTTMKATLSVGHDASLQPAPPFSALAGYAVMPAAGGLYSTVDDLLTVASVAIGYQRSPLAPAIAASVRTRRPMQSPGREQALGWIVITEGPERLIFHDGGSFGYASAIAWDPARRIGVAVLSNHSASVSDIARHLLQPEFPLEKPVVTKHKETLLDVAILDRYRGRYDAPDEGIFIVDLEGNVLTIQAPAEWGLPKLGLHPESEEAFFARELPLRVTFRRDTAGRIDAMLVYPPRGQKPVLASRVKADE
jgi:serine-type D-Ala-D-Ala carboxypeptidase/endopeptidase